MTIATTRLSSPSTHAAWRLPGATLLWAGLAVAAYLLGEPALRLLEYDRLAIGSGALYRLVTGHLTHFSASHLFWDVLMFCVLGTFIESEDRRAWRTVVLISAIVISLGLLVGDPSLQHYRGFSGIDSALFAFIATRWLGRSRELRWLGATALLAVLGKSAYEWMTGATLFADIDSAGVSAVPLAHLLGAATGAFIALGERGACITRRRVTDATRVSGPPDPAGPARNTRSTRRRDGSRAA